MSVHVRRNTQIHEKDGEEVGAPHRLIGLKRRMVAKGWLCCYLKFIAHKEARTFAGSFVQYGPDTENALY